LIYRFTRQPTSGGGALAAKLQGSAAGGGGWAEQTKKKQVLAVKRIPVYFLQLSLSLRLVSRVRKQSHESCSLDSLGELSLVESTCAGYTTGKDLGSFGHALLELCGVLIINGGSSIYAEHANLLMRSFAGSCGISLHFSILLSR